MEHQTLPVNGIRFHEEREGAGPLVLLLHGFPEFWYSWRKQIGPLAAAGFTVAAPDLRGYNQTEQRGPFDIGTLVDDVIGLIEGLGQQRCALVGHDWGGVIAWAVAALYPERLTKMAILNLPHPLLLQKATSRPSRQLLRSWYALFFQIPKLPEFLLRRSDYQPILEQMRNDSVPGAFTRQDLEEYRQMLRRTDMSGPIGYYRALLKQPKGYRAALKTIKVPTLHIWGERDRYLGMELLKGTEQYVPDYRLRTIPWASHWVQSDAPGIVNEELIKFFS